MLPRLMELRNGMASTVFGTRFSKKKWRPMPGGVLVDMIMGGIMHSGPKSKWERPTCGSAANRTASNKIAPGPMLAPEPKRNNGGAA